jgi:phosphatidylserine/phosphatidylglycerophosphate/cardiolipin synthase-like enzyme
VAIQAHLRIRAAAGHIGGNAAAIRQAVPAGNRDHVDPLNRAWAATPDTHGKSIALALDTVLANRRLMAAGTVDVVVTGPDSPAAPVRLTSEVVRQLIGSAQQRVTLVSYAAYKMASIVTALDDAAARGVRIDLILESADQREPPDAKLPITPVPPARTARLFGY